MGSSSDDWGLESVAPSHTSSSGSSFKRVVRKVNSNAKCRLCLWVVALWCAITILFMLVGYDRVVDKVAVGQMVLHEGGGQKYDAWKSAPMPVYYKVTAFNLTNPQSFMNGARPRLAECGPYVYRMLEEKMNVSFHKNFSVTYRTKPIYIFEPSLSGGSEEDVITTVNIPLVNAADAVKHNKFLKTVIQFAQKMHGFQTLRKLKVKELLWGYDSHVMNWARQLQELPYPHPQFGLLVGYNNTPQESYTMYTGEENSSQMNGIFSWNKKTKLDFWFGDYCNEIRGTDASGFHPNVKETDVLHIFNGQLCRSLPLVFERKINHKDIEAYRFVPPDSTFAYDASAPQNQCFCSKNGCPEKGLLDMKPCYWGAAVAFSFPHFYGADPVLRHIVQGLNPDRERHQTQFDIYPKLGVPLRVKLRMQMNVMLDESQALQRARHFNIIFPVFWFEAGIDSLPSDMVGLLQMAQNLPPVVKTTSVIVCAVLTVVFLLVLLASSFAGSCGVVTESRSPTPDHLPEKPVPWHTKGILPHTLSSPVVPTAPPPSYCHPSYVLPADETDGAAVKDMSEPYTTVSEVYHTSAPETHEGSSSTIISAEIHTSASESDVTEGAPVVPEDGEIRMRSSSITVDEFYSGPGQETVIVTPLTPPPEPGSPIVVPLATLENTETEQNKTVLEEANNESGSDLFHNSVLRLASDGGSSCISEHSSPVLSHGSPVVGNSNKTSGSNSPKPPPLESDL